MRADILVVARAGLSVHRHKHFADVESAWDAACNEASPADTIVVFGSFYTVAAVMALIQGYRDGA